MIEVGGFLKDIKFEDTFVVSQISEDIIFGIQFLTQQGCSMEFHWPTTTVDGMKLICTDRQSRLPYRPEMVLSCQLADNQYCPTRLI